MSLPFTPVIIRGWRIWRAYWKHLLILCVVMDMWNLHIVSMLKMGLTAFSSSSMKHQWKYKRITVLAFPYRPYPCTRLFESPFLQVCTCCGGCTTKILPSLWETIVPSSRTSLFKVHLCWTRLATIALLVTQVKRELWSASHARRTLTLAKLVLPRALLASKPTSTLLPALLAAINARSVLNKTLSTRDQSALSQIVVAW
mmetsp:Transcript_11070/g.29043  ORF Transcript_11070/g.29043 Transcript_11070/m.29043 type:complete len:200 (+) Transcript_11070:734-1333(+)